VNTAAKQASDVRSSLVLHHCSFSRSMRIRWLLEEMKLSYELVTHRFDPAFFGTDVYLKINPMGKVPALQDDGKSILESTAIMAYLLGRYGRDSPLDVDPSDAEYGAFQQWLHMAEAGVANYASIYLGHVVLPTSRYRVSEAFLSYCDHQIEKALGYLSTALSEREYLLRRGFTAADISMGWTLYMIDTLCNRTLPDGPLRDYLVRLQGRAAWKKIEEPWVGPTKTE
jgi:glutathione S-transferase